MKRRQPAGMVLACWLSPEFNEATHVAWRLCREAMDSGSRSSPVASSTPSTRWNWAPRPRAAHGTPRCRGPTSPTADGPPVHRRRDRRFGQDSPHAATVLGVDDLDCQLRPFQLVGISDVPRDTNWPSGDVRHPGHVSGRRPLRPGRSARTGASGRFPRNNAGIGNAVTSLARRPQSGPVSPGHSGRSRARPSSFRPTRMRQLGEPVSRLTVMPGIVGGRPSPHLP